MTVLTSALDLLAAVPNPGNGTAPPGFDKFETMLGWVKYLALGVLIVSLIIAGAKLGFSESHSGGGREAAAVGRTLLGVIIVSGAFTIVTFLV